MMLLQRTFVIFIFLLVGFLPGLVCAQVSGGILYGTGQYRAEVDGEKVRSISSTYQQVDLTYHKKGTIGDARLGTYTLMLGYEFSVINPSVTNYGVKDTANERVTAKKPFYEASLLFAPGGLPFRLSAYARDVHHTTFVNNVVFSALPVGIQGSTEYNLLDPDLPMTLDNGTHRQLGATLLIGIRNGSYLGVYRDVLSQLPRLLIDYKQTEVRALSTANKRHYRARDLAFVSLNKLNNWVHLRTRDYVDYLNPENDSEQTQVLIGSIDQLMDRKWINLTNWLKISGDISYNVNRVEKIPVPTRSYIVNMMAMGRRHDLSTSMVSQFSRATDGDTVELNAQIPISMTVELNRDTLFRTHVSYAAEETSLYEGGVPNTTDNKFLSTARDFYFDTQLELLRSRQVQVIPRFVFEFRNEDSRLDGMAGRVGAEVLSNALRRNSLDWMGGYALTVIRATQANDEDLSESDNYIQNEIYGRVDKNLGRSLRAGSKGTLSTGIGSERQLMSFRIQTLPRSGEGRQITSGALSFYLDHNYQLLQNRMALSFDFVTDADGTQKQGSLTHSLNYSNNKHLFKWESSVDFSSNANSVTSSDKTIDMDYLRKQRENSSQKVTWNSKTEYDYNPNRSTALTLTGQVSGAQSISYGLSEELVYRVFTVNGIIRRVAEFAEKIGYEKVGQATDGRSESLYGHFSAAYYPFRYLYCKIASEISYLSGSTLQQISNAEVGFDFQKLKLMANYSEGKKGRESVVLPEVMERRWEVKVKKIF